MTLPVAHPTLTCVGRKCGVDPGPHDNTAGRGVVVVVVVGPWEVVVEARAAMDLVVAGENLEPRCNSIASPTPRAARTATTMPTRMTVLRRRVITRGSWSAIVERYFGKHYSMADLVVGHRRRSTQRQEGVGVVWSTGMTVSREAYPRPDWRTGPRPTPVGSVRPPRTRAGGPLTCLARGRTR